jgi:hypothetical protein
MSARGRRGLPEASRSDGLQLDAGYRGDDRERLDFDHVVRVRERATWTIVEAGPRSPKNSSRTMRKSIR